MGTIVLPPYSEVFGRKMLFIASAGLYALSCVFTAAVPSLAAVITGCFITGLLCFMPSTIVLGNVEDMWIVTDRIVPIYLLQTVTIIVLALGPIMGTYITNTSFN